MEKNREGGVCSEGDNWLVSHLTEHIIMEVGITWLSLKTTAAGKPVGLSKANS